MAEKVKHGCPDCYLNHGDAVDLARFLRRCSQSSIYFCSCNSRLSIKLLGGRVLCSSMSALYKRFKVEPQLDQFPPIDEGLLEDLRLQL